MPVAVGRLRCFHGSFCSSLDARPHSMLAAGATKTPYGDATWRCDLAMRPGDATWRRRRAPPRWALWSQTEVLVSEGPIDVWAPSTVAVRVAFFSADERHERCQSSAAPTTSSSAPPHDAAIAMAAPELRDDDDDGDDGGGAVGAGSAGGGGDGAGARL